VPDAALSTEALAVAAQLSLSAYDAVHVVLAARRNVPVWPPIAASPPPTRAWS
jgi:predicted nucleic acid-binding protein